jgi:hypothetical protein
MCLWANLHGAFFTGFVLIGIYLVGSRSRTLVWVLLACAAASLVNPNGWKLHAQVLQFLRTPELAQFTNEFRSPNFHSGGARGFVLVLLTLAELLLVARPRLSASEVWLLGVWGYFALHSVRNVPIFALVAAPILTAHWNAFLQSVGRSRWMDWYRRVSARVTGVSQSADGRALAVVSGAALWVAAGCGLARTEPLADRFPVAAVEWLRANPQAVSGEMFNDYGWGGYLMLVLPERRVFVDGRNDFYGRQLVEEFNTVDDVKPGWEKVLEKYRVGWTILPPKHGLNALLALRADWRRVYADQTAVIYARRQRMASGSI